MFRLTFNSCWIKSPWIELLRVRMHVVEFFLLLTDLDFGIIFVLANSSSTKVRNKWFKHCTKDSFRSWYNYAWVQVQQWCHNRCWFSSDSRLMDCITDCPESYRNQSVFAWNYGWWSSWLLILGTSTRKGMQVRKAIINRCSKICVKHYNNKYLIYISNINL